MGSGDLSVVFIDTIPFHFAADHRSKQGAGHVVSADGKQVKDIEIGPVRLCHNHMKETMRLLWEIPGKRIVGVLGSKNRELIGKAAKGSLLVYHKLTHSPPSVDQQWESCHWIITDAMLTALQRGSPGGKITATSLPLATVKAFGMHLDNVFTFLKGNSGPQKTRTKISFGLLASNSLLTHFMYLPQPQVAAIKMSDHHKVFSLDLDVQYLAYRAWGYLVSRPTTQALPAPSLPFYANYLRSVLSKPRSCAREARG